MDLKMGSFFFCCVIRQGEASKTPLLFLSSSGGVMGVPNGPGSNSADISRTGKGESRDRWSRHCDPTREGGELDGVTDVNVGEASALVGVPLSKASSPSWRGTMPWTKTDPTLADGGPTAT